MSDVKRAYDCGWERGYNASLVADHPCGPPSPLSGEWAGESIPELSAQYGVDLWDGEVADAFESGFYDGWGEWS